MSDDNVNEKHITGGVVEAEQHRKDEELAETHDGDFGTKRDLTPRVVSMIAVAGTIGTGLFLGSGAALTVS
jgi:amino acid transporter